MLEAIIEQMELRTEFLFGAKPCLVSVFPHDDGNVQLACNQQRLITKVARRASWIDNPDAFILPPVATGQHVKTNASVPQKLAQQNDEWSLAGASDGNVADADYWPAK